MNVIRRGGRASLHRKAKPSTGTRHVVDAGMVGRETRVTEGDLAGSDRGRRLCRNRRHKGNAENGGATRSQSGP